jgi:hypothetical protein
VQPQGIQIIPVRKVAEAFRTLIQK